MGTKPMTIAIHKILKFEEITYFGPRVLPRGFLVIALIRPWSVCPSVFKYLRDRSLAFSNFLYEVRVLQGIFDVFLSISQHPVIKIF